MQTSNWNTPLSCPGRYDGRVGIITGGASGIGKATVIRMIREGGTVIVGDVNIVAGNILMEEARQNGYGEQCQFLSCDVVREKDIEQLTKYAEKEFGRLDLMVNNAAAGGAIGRLLDIKTDDWDATFQLVLNSVFWGTRAAAKTMIALRCPGSIVNVSSIAAIAPGCSIASYAAAKAAVNNMTQSAVLNLGHHGIRCNIVSPSAIITPFLAQGDDPNLLDRAAVNSQPWPDVGRPEHVAAAILYLGSDQSKSVTGCILDVGGGAVASGPVLFEWKPYGEIVNPV